MKKYFYSLVGADGQTGQVFPTCDEARAERQPNEDVVEYTYNLEDRWEDGEPVVWYNGIVFEGEEEKPNRCGGM